jgi:putative hemolysin
MGDLIPLDHFWIPGVVAMLCLVLASGFFSASETALFYLSHDELRGLRAGRPREHMAASLLSNPDRLLTAILFWNLLINLSYFASSVVVAHRLGEKAGYGAAGGFGLLSLIGIILFGEVLPKSVAVVYRLRLASSVSWPLALSVHILDPITPVLGKISRVMRRTFWPHIDREVSLDADDLERAVEASRSSNDVIGQERQILHNILDLSEIAVEEVMRPRGTYVTQNPPVHLADLKGDVPAGDYLALPGQESEEIERVIPLADFSTIPQRHLEEAAESIVHVPWCANLAQTLQFIRDNFATVASVVNEYGETIGIVTYEDLIDTIFEPDPSRARRLLKRDPVVETADGRYQVEGITTLRYLCKRLNLEFEPASDGLHTVAGMVYEELEHIPVVDDECIWRGYRIKVIEVENRSRMRVMIWKEQEFLCSE